ncbi:MAG TPA: hypothetical protein DDZ80_16060 [Cyanobacteria bacterium UBA8803]|nr:hypothetical protein [Cyanobacteria bacterium UBA9273]HBL59930.1 hypothetical protein [Cyanobacteria bacterium UBA8803]
MATKSNKGEQAEQKTEHRGPDKGEAYGVAAVTQALAGLDFPANKKEILKKIKGHEEINWAKEKTINLRSLIEQMDSEEFDGMPSIIEAISQEVREGEKSAHGKK